METKRTYYAVKHNNNKMLEGREWIQILSKDTGEIYIDENCTGHIFEKQEDAEKFIEDVSQAEESEYALRLECSKKSVIDYNSFSWICICIGITAVKINEKEKIMIKKSPDEKGYANPELSKNVNLLLETSKVEYLKEFGNQHFIVPVYIQTINISSSGFTKTNIMYGTVSEDPGGKNNKDHPVYYLVFTDMDHYTGWSKEHGRMFEPLEVEYWQLAQIIGESGVCVNPEATGAFILTQENLSCVEFKEPEAITEKENAE